MKGRAKNKYYDILLLVLYFILPAIGWFVHGIGLAIIGLIVAYGIDFFSPKWKSELTWKDIDLAIKNLYRYGRNPSLLWFCVGERKILVYRDEKGGETKPVRMAVSVPIDDWSDLLDQEDYHELVSKHGGKGIPSTYKGHEYYDIFTKIDREGPEDCKEMLKFLFQKAVGGLRPEIMAQSVANTSKVIWLDHSQDEQNQGLHKRNTPPS